MERGYVKLWRKIEDSAVMDDAELLRLWVWLLINVNRKPRQMLSGNIVPAGSVTTTYGALAERFDCSKATIHRRMHLLEALGMVSITAERGFSVVTINNWTTYQSQEEASRTLAERKPNASRTEGERKPNVLQEREKLRKEEGEKFLCGEVASDSPPQPATDQPSEFSFVIAGKGDPEWWLPLRKLSEYRESFPDLDVAAEMRAARQWCRDNRANRKTAKGMPAFLGSWLRNAQNKPWMRAAPGKANGSPASKYHVELPE